MPAVSKKQQRFFGYLLSNPEERKKKGISKKAAQDFAQDVKEAVKGQDTASRREGAKERAADKKSGKIRKNTLDPKDYATQEKKSIEWHDKRTKGRYSPGQVTDVHEVSPPGWGHTKAEKEKTKPWKPKSKIGGSAAEFNKDLKSGKFKGLPGDKTYKEKKASMFKLMWSMYNKSKKSKDGKFLPHFKPGTDKKYKKYQDKDEANEEKQLTSMQDNNLYGNAYERSGDSWRISGKPSSKKKKKLKEASYKEYMAQAQAARERLKKKHDTRKEKDAAYVDRVKKGVKFYDKKGSGRLVKGKKVYD